MSDRTCSIDGCDRPHMARSWCNAHYQRWKSKGDPGDTPIAAGSRKRAFCSVHGCEGEVKGQGLCGMHYERWSKHGDPTVVKKPGSPSGPTHPTWKGTDIGYTGAHRRVVRLRGPAAQYACVDCGKTAEDWSYDNADPNELIGSDPWDGIAYSADPAHYWPRCRSCHRKHDGAHVGKRRR